MQAAAQALGRAGVRYLGPSAAVMARCYDKWEAHRIASAGGIDCPATVLATDARGLAFPLIVKPRRGSDSIGMRLVRDAPIPRRARGAHYVAQERIVGAELTVAVIGGRAGTPLKLDLPEGTPYTFARKYLLRPARGPLADAALAERVRALALEIAGLFAVNWAARVDLIHETATGRLRFLECDVAPLVGPDSAFAASLAAAGMPRAEQLELLLA
jgi:biotin carboxylase